MLPTGIGGPTFLGLFTVLSVAFLLYAAIHTTVIRGSPGIAFLWTFGVLVVVVTLFPKTWALAFKDTCLIWSSGRPFVTRFFSIHCGRVGVAIATGGRGITRVY